jgi:hypothetical protein
VVELVVSLVQLLLLLELQILVAVAVVAGLEILVLTAVQE